MGSILTISGKSNKMDVPEKVIAEQSNFKLPVKELVATYKNENDNVAISNSGNNIGSSYKHNEETIVK